MTHNSGQYHRYLWKNLTLYICSFTASLLLFISLNMKVIHVLFFLLCMKILYVYSPHGFHNFVQLIRSCKNRVVLSFKMTCIFAVGQLKIFLLFFYCFTCLELAVIDISTQPYITFKLLMFSHTKTDLLHALHINTDHICELNKNKLHNIKTLFF